VAAPNRGDLVWIDFDPQSGHEQAGRRPALVLSPRSYHQLSPYALVCPITQTVKGYPFEVVLPAGLTVSGAILADQVKSIDRRSRRIEPAGKAPDSVVQDVIAKILPLFFEGGAAGKSIKALI
jgi:mRNA interferase MazF